jgi:hypothetical protein
MTSTKIGVLFVLIVIAATMEVRAQSTVSVPGNASGYFGNPVDQLVPFVPAITVTGPGTITVTYVSGTVDVGGGHVVGPIGLRNWPSAGNQYPLLEAKGIVPQTADHVGGLIGVFVPAARVSSPGFTAIDGTKNAAPVGIMPGGLFFIGAGKTFAVKQAGTLFLGINETLVGDNSGSFTVTVTVQ